MREEGDRKGKKRKRRLGEEIKGKKGGKYIKKTRERKDRKVRQGGTVERRKERRLGGKGGRPKESQ